jgi:hypothetical protein
MIATGRMCARHQRAGPGHKQSLAAEAECGQETLYLSRWRHQRAADGKIRPQPSLDTGGNTPQDRNQS